MAIQVTAIFRSSVEVMISVWGETPEYAGDMFHCGDAYATIVSGRGTWESGWRSWSHDFLCYLIATS